MDLLTTSAGAAVFLLAGAVHRVTGMGFALLALPPFVLLAGAEDAVTLVALGAMLASVGVGWSARRGTDRPAAVVLVIGVLIGCVLGLAVAVMLPATVLTLGIGILILLGVAASAWARWGARRPEARALRRRPLAIAGVVSGVMNAISGVGGPPLGVAASWLGMRHAVFVPTVQVPFVAMGLVTVGGRLAVVGVPALAWPAWTVLVIALVAGVIAGGWASRVIAETVAWVATLALAAAGAALLLAGTVS